MEEDIMTVKKLKNYARDLGWVQVRRKGSHMIYNHSVTGGMLVIPHRQGKDLNRGLYLTILKQIKAANDEVMK